MTSLGKFELHEEVGKGGFGTVYRATDTWLDREEALKILHPQLIVDNNFITRFRKEARLLASLDNHHIVTVFEMGEEDGRFYIAMRYLPGGNLKARIQKSKHLPFKEAARIMGQVMDGLEDAHQKDEKHKGLVHRDMKPENILFDSHDNAVITDFGLVSESTGSSFSIGPSGGILGTPSYIAPEVWNGSPATKVSDIYALGCIFYEMLTGSILFDGKTPWEIMKKHDEELSLPEKWPADVPAGIAAFLEKALAKEPPQRFQTVAEMHSELNGLLTEGQKAPGEPEPREKEKVSGSGKTEGEGVGVAAPEKQRIRIGKWGWIAIGAVLAATAAAFILFNVLRFHGFYYSSGISGGKEIYYLNATHAVQQVTSSRSGFQTWNPAIGPDGSVYFTCNRYESKAEICAMNPDNGQVYRSTYTPGNFESWDAAPYEGGNLYFTSNRNGKVEIFLMNSKAEIQEVVHSGSGYENWDAAPVKGGKLYFTSNMEEGKAEIYLLENGLVKRVTHTPGNYESWDPTLDESGKLYFTSNRGGGTSDIYVIELDGAVRRVTTSPATTSSWNPAPGKAGRLYFSSNRFGKTEILMMDAGGKVTEVVAIPGSDEGRTPDPESGMR